MAQREVRLGLVLYGGVSLAIYENGVVQEIYRAICGDGVFELLRELIDSDIVVDVISGTSAGGVNGVMLGYCLARGYDFLPAAQLWRDAGDIQKLLRKPGNTDDSSLLDSAYYQEQLALCYGKTLREPTGGRTAPSLSELDLFVTGTDAHGVTSTVYDELGHPIDVKNHRALFQLQYRGDGVTARKNDFEFGDRQDGADQPIPVPPEDLATLSRLTSGFPAAFKPTEITAEDKNFFRWGKLSGPAVYMDGGILNNKPFTSTINAISTRTATREVERFLIYVEPRPEQFQTASGKPQIPTLAEAAISSLTSIPSYQSIAADLQAIEAHNERAQRFQKIIGALGEAPKSGSDCLLSTGVLPGALDGETKPYITARLTMVNDAAIGAILDSASGHRQFFPPEQATRQGGPLKGFNSVSPPENDCRRSGRLLVQSFWHWRGDPGQTLVDYDVFFRKRRADHLSNTLMQVLKARCGKKPMDVPREAWEAVNHFFKLFEIAEWAMKTWLTRCDLNWKRLSSDNPNLDSLNECDRHERLGEIASTIWGGAQHELDRLMTCAVDVPLFDCELTGLVEKRKKFYDDLHSWLKEPVPGNNPNLLTRLDDALKDAITNLEHEQATDAVGKLLRDEFCRFVDVDRQLLPLQIGSGFESTNVIRVVRFSPLDAQRGLSEGPVERKVRGAALANFGAFFKKGWRASDIMMGRFDSVCLLTECLLTKERLAALKETRRRPGGLPYEVPAGMVSRCLPKAAPTLEAQINAYFAAALPAVGTWNSIVDQIVVAAQADILTQEQQQVAQCALDQQYAWGQYKQDDSLPEDLLFPSRWTGAKSSPDEILVQIAANAVKNGILPPYSLPPEKDFLEEVPLTAMQETVSLAMIRLGKSIGASIPAKHRQAVSDSLTFRVTMQWLPAFFYRLVYTRRTQPDWVLVPIVLLFNLAVVAILAFAWMAEQQSRLSLKAAVLTTGVAFAAVVVQWTLTQRRQRWIPIGVLTLLLIGAVAVYLASLTELATALKYLLTFFVIALVGFIPLRSILARLFMAALVLLALFLLWGPSAGLGH